MFEGRLRAFGVASTLRRFAFPTHPLYPNPPQLTSKISVTFITLFEFAIELLYPLSAFAIELLKALDEFIPIPIPISCRD
jgi:hypothetical protein